MAKAKKTNYAVLKSGERYAITGKMGRYWICGDRAFRKANVTVETEKEEAEPPKED